MANDPTKPDYITLPPDQWAELMGKFDAIATAISGLSLSVPPANLTPIVDGITALTTAVDDLAHIDVTRDHGYYRDHIRGLTHEET